MALVVVWATGCRPCFDGVQVVGGGSAELRVTPPGGDTVSVSVPGASRDELRDPHDTCYGNDGRTRAFLEGDRNDLLSVCVAASFEDYPELEPAVGACAGADGFFAVWLHALEEGYELTVHGLRDVPVAVEPEDCTTGEVSASLTEREVGCALGRVELSWQFDPAVARAGSGGPGTF